jgi:ATP-dependent RNA helicase DDX5/DBP2
MIAIAKTGSGKTFSYMIPCLMKVLAFRKQLPAYRSVNNLFLHFPLGLILAPTRELANQIYNASLGLANKCGIRLAVVYGGASKEGQLSDMTDGVDVLIATPGRLLDFLNSGNINVSAVAFFVLDEADRMLVGYFLPQDMGFYPQVRGIAETMSPAKQTMFLSATWPAEVQELSSELCKNNPVRLKIGEENLTLNNAIVQNTEYVSEADKRRRMLELMKSHNSAGAKFIVFTRTKKNCDRVCKMLENEGYRAIAIHGDKHQKVGPPLTSKRDYIISSFRNSFKNILVATDVASRGLGMLA